jgi:alkanesulfonate monooxygenase SsuD/methylene tetrahydromethanopterin reductase-like flavin-dependent oxidoreductase (luciferase family)
MTGAIADGWVGTSFMPEHADVYFDRIRAGAARAVRDFSQIDLQAGGVVAFSDDVESLYPARKPGVAFTLGAMGSREHNFYNEAYRRMGYEELGIEAQKAWLQGRKEEAAAMVPDEVVAQTNLLGTDDLVKGRIRAYREAGVTSIRVDPAGRSLGERLETLGRFMGLLSDVNAES